MNKDELIEEVEKLDEQLEELMRNYDNSFDDWNKD